MSPALAKGKCMFPVDDLNGASRAMLSRQVGTARSKSGGLPDSVLYGRTARVVSLELFAASELARAMPWVGACGGQPRRSRLRATLSPSPRVVGSTVARISWCDRLS